MAFTFKEYNESDEVKRLRDLANSKQEYVPADSVNNARTAMEQHDANKVADWTGGTYGDDLKAAIDKINNREKFTYDLNGDALYQQYKDKYIKQGKLAMIDATGQAAALTGGYGNSYAQTVGQQTYQGYLNNLNDIVPELYQMAYDRYDREGNEMMNRASLLNTAYQNEYGQHRDEVADWQAEQNRLEQRYYNESNLDYTRFSDDRNFTNTQYNNERQYDYGLYSDEYNRAFSSYQQQVAESEFAAQMAYNYAQLAAQQEYQQAQLQMQQAQMDADAAYKQAQLDMQKERYAIEDQRYTTAYNDQKQAEKYARLQSVSDQTAARKAAEAKAQQEADDKAYERYLDSVKLGAQYGIGDYGYLYDQLNAPKYSGGGSGSSGGGETTIKPMSTSDVNTLSKYLDANISGMDNEDLINYLDGFSMSDEQKLSFINRYSKRIGNSGYTSNSVASGGGTSADSWAGKDWKQWK